MPNRSTGFYRQIIGLFRVRFAFHLGNDAFVGLIFGMLANTGIHRETIGFCWRSIGISLGFMRNLSLNIGVYWPNFPQCWPISAFTWKRLALIGIPLGFDWGLLGSIGNPLGQSHFPRWATILGFIGNSEAFLMGLLIPVLPFYLLVLRKTQ